MTNSLIQGMRARDNYTRTENSAVTHKSTLNDVLDFYYHAPARRGKDNTLLFANAYGSDRILALKALFYTRDIRGGGRIGERATFRQGLRYLYTHERAVFDRIVLLVPEYGRWDDIIEYVDSSVVVDMIRAQLREDLKIAQSSDSPVSLLAKWMPSINTSSKVTRALARKWIQKLGVTEGQYRRGLSLLRKRINIVERLMSAGQFGSINYAQVPSNAAMRYRKAFSRKDGDRYVKYLEDVKAGKTTIKATTLYPYEIVGKYLNGHSFDATLEAQWSALPNYLETPANAMVIADVSGSMAGRPVEVSVSLAIYFAQRNKGPFEKHFMTFSGEGKLHALRGNTLQEIIRNVVASDTSWNQNTNIQAAFDKILSTGIKYNVPAEEMPAMLFIISDMEFDMADSRGRTNFEVIRSKYSAAGYKMPKLVFWNVESRNDQTPVTEKTEGVYLVSGMSAGVFSSAINARTTTPIDMMVETLNSARYATIEEVLL